MESEINTQQITIDIPQTIVGHITAVQIEQEFKRFFAVKCYLDENVSISQAADIAGMRRIDFETYLSQNKTPISLLTYEDIMADLEKMKEIAAPAR
jgi:predicted HTH domain antitoxin